MKRFGVSIAAGAVLLGGLALTESAHAGEIVLGTSGWMATFDQGIDITYFGQSAQFTSVSIEKFARFRSTEPLEIIFTQVSASATPFINIADEFVKNDSGQDWSHFTFSLQSDGLNGTQPKFDVAKSATFNIDPFTSRSYSNGDTVLEVTGGILPDAGDALEDVWKPGEASGSLVIAAAPFGTGNLRQSFRFIESPSTIIPLPPAALSGLLGLVMLGAPIAVRRIRKG